MDRTVASTNPRGTSAIGIVGTIALVLLVVGGLNWALVGLFNFDLVAAIFGTMTTVSRAVYVIVGIAAIYALSLLPRFSRLT